WSSRQHAGELYWPLEMPINRGIVGGPIEPTAVEYPSLTPARRSAAIALPRALVHPFRVLLAFSLHAYRAMRVRLAAARIIRHRWRRRPPRPAHFAALAMRTLRMFF